MKNAIGKEIPAAIAGIDKVLPYKGLFDAMPEGRIAGKTKKMVKPGDSKLLNSIEEAVEKSGLKDGMTISFHHHFRGGDYIVNKVMDVIAAKGIKNIRICSSSLNDVHAPLVDHIKNGVVASISSSGLRGKLAEAISRGLMEIPVVIRSHGGRARAIEAGEEHIDVAFLGAPSSDDYGNANGYGKAVCGSLGYAMIDAKYADTVVILTDNLVDYPNTPVSIPQTDVDYVVLIDSIGDSSKIGGKETRFTKNPRDLLIAEYCAKVIYNSPYFKNGFSFQTGSGGASLAMSRFLRTEMEKQNIKASFSLGGITKPMVEMLKDGFIGKLFDVQSFDLIAANSIRENENHYEIDATYYANTHTKGCIANKLDVVVLSALEIDTNFNINVITGSDGVIRGASGGHSDTAAAAKLTIITAPLIRGRIPTIVDNVLNIVTPGTNIDILVTDRGVALNRNSDKYEEIKTWITKAGIKVFEIEELRDLAYKMTGVPQKIEYTDKIVGVIEYRDGTIIDVIHEIKE